MPMFSPYELLKVLRESLQLREDDYVVLKVYRETRDPFKVIVAAILSQNTTEANAFAAYYRLEETVGVDPDAILAAEPGVIESAIRVAGLQRQKARAIRELARLVARGLDLRALACMEADEARAVLSSVPGLGQKTADVFLALFKGGVIPVDTHVRRVARRLGLTDSSTYEGVRQDLESFFPPELRLEAHLYLIALGRKYCKARAPRCSQCPLRDTCPLAREFLTHSVTTEKGLKTKYGNLL